MKKLFLLPVFITLLMVSSSYKSEQISDPEVFATKVWSFIQKKDSVGFVNLLKLSKEDILTITTAIENDKYIPATKKADALKFIKDTSFFNKVNSQIAITYNKTQQYFKDNKLDVSKSSIAFIEFEIEKEDALPFIVLEDLDVFIKLDATNYKIQFDDIIQLKGIYKGIRGGRVVKLNEEFEVNDYIFSETTVDSTSVSAVVDSVSDIDESATASSVYDQSQMSAKQKKYYKKIEKLNKQTELLYQKIAEEDMVFEK